MTVPKPNERLMRLGYMLQNHAAIATTAALEVIHERLSRLDGIPTQGENASVTTSAGTSTTEAIALQRYELVMSREQVRDDIAAIETMVSDYLRMVRRIIGRPLAEDVHELVPMCRDNQVGRAGADEWGDASCCKPADKAGLCGAHYQAARRYKLAHGIRDTTVEPAA